MTTVKSFDKLPFESEPEGSSLRVEDRPDTKRSRSVKTLNSLANKIKPRQIGFFFLGIFLGLLSLGLGLGIFFELKYQNKIYPRVEINGFPVGGMTRQEVLNFLDTQNQQFNNIKITFAFFIPDEDSKIATLSAQQLKIGYGVKLLTDQAFLIGRTGNVFTAILQKFTQNNLPASYTYDDLVLDNLLKGLAEKIDMPAKDALFQFTNGRVTAFSPSVNGRAIDHQKAKDDLLKLVSPPKSGTIILSTMVVLPKIDTSQANNLGIKELIGEGVSYFRGSISNRIYNLTLASSRLNGLLIAPGEIFSFNQAIGEVNAQTGYKQAYVIKEKRTVLDDGGGVCQVSTTLFRAALNTGLPIEQRRAHAYRVGYYEQGFGPGLDATVYAPETDLKIKNDTSAHILVQTAVNNQNSQLIIDLYGTADGRVATISKPKVWDEVKPLEDLYQDDRALPKGETKQIDWAAWGAKTSFDYKVTRKEEILQNKTFYSNFQPWQAVYLRGTRE